MHAGAVLTAPNVDKNIAALGAMSGGSGSDVLLLSRVQQGDETAMAQLYDSYSALVFSIAFKVLHDRSAAEDVLQDVFLRIWRRPASFVAVRGSFGSWLSVMARNRAIDLLRQRRRTEPVDEVRLFAPGNLAADVEVLVLSAKVRSLLANLPSSQQELLDLVYFRGRTHKEAAESTRTPLGTVKTRVRTALLALRHGIQHPEPGQQLG